MTRGVLKIRFWDCDEWCWPSCLYRQFIPRPEHSLLSYRSWIWRVCFRLLAVCNLVTALSCLTVGYGFTPSSWAITPMSGMFFYRLSSDGLCVDGIISIEALSAAKIRICLGSIDVSRREFVGIFPGLIGRHSENHWGLKRLLAFEDFASDTRREWTKLKDERSWSELS